MEHHCLHPSHLPPSHPFAATTQFQLTIVSRLFERAAEAVGLDFLGQAFWDKYLEFEDRLDNHDKVFAILKRLISIPQHQYSRYFERFRRLSTNQPLDALADPETLATLRNEVLASYTDGRQRSELEIDRDIRNRIDSFYVEINGKTQAETMKRWTYEQNIKRPYFHVTELEEDQLVNWRKYLDFEEAEGDTARIVFLYERCLVTCAYYDEFWLRYVRYMYTMGKQEDVRIIFQKASCIYAPIAKPQIRHNWAIFEEQLGNIETARAIYESILTELPDDVKTVVDWANFERRHGGLDAAIDVYQRCLLPQDKRVTKQVQGALIAEWARLIWKIKGKPDEARQVFTERTTLNIGVREFWEAYLRFELDQPFHEVSTATTTNGDTTHSAPKKNLQESRVRAVWTAIRDTSGLELDALCDLSELYKSFLLEHGSGQNGAAAREILTLDSLLFGPESLRKAADKPY